MRSDGILSVIKEKPVHEGNQIGVKSYSESLVLKSPRAFVSEINLDRHRLIREGPSYSMELLTASSKSTREELSKHAYQDIQEYSKGAGTTFDAGAQMISFDIFLKFFQMLEIDFDDAGKPHMPTIITKTGDLANKFRHWQNNPEYIARMEAVINEKRQVWRDRESNRKLVD